MPTRVQFSDAFEPSQLNVSCRSGVPSSDAIHQNVESRLLKKPVDSGPAIRAIEQLDSQQGVLYTPFKLLLWRYKTAFVIILMSTLANNNDSSGTKIQTNVHSHFPLGIRGLTVR